MAEPDGPRRTRPRRLSPAARRRLAQPLDPALISEREAEDGELVRYLEGWRAIDQANAVFGPDRRGADVVGEVAYRPLPVAGRGRTALTGVYTATIRVTVDGCLPHADVGTAAVSEHTAEAHAVATKAAVTDALKRALRHFGVTWNGVKRMGRTASCLSTPIV